MRVGKRELFPTEGLERWVRSRQNIYGRTGQKPRLDRLAGAGTWPDQDDPFGLGAAAARGRERRKASRKKTSPVKK